MPMEQLLEEARQLASGGVKELILVAQETTLTARISMVGSPSKAAA